MSGYGYPQNPPGYAYGYGAPPPPTAQPYGAPDKPAKDNHHHSPSGQGYGYGSGAPPPTAQPYGAPPSSAQSYGGSPSAPPYGKPDKPPKDNHAPSAPPPSGSGYNYPSAPPPSGPGYSSSYSNYPSAPPQNYGGSGSGHGSGYSSGPPQQYGGHGSGSGYSSGSPQQYGGRGGGGYPPQQTSGGLFASLLPSTFPPGTDPSVIACFQVADLDGSGLIDDKELQKALSSYNQSFSLRTVHLLMVHFTNSNSRKIGPKEFTSLFYGLQSWREIFERFDKDRSGKIDATELRDALFSLGFAVSPLILDLLVSKFDKTGGKSKAIEYDNFIECCLTVKGLTEKFKEKDTQYRGSATFSYEEFMLCVLPYLVA